MTAIAHVARVYALADRDLLCVATIAAFTLATAQFLLLQHGSFARVLAAIGLSPAG